ncbi:Dihydrofolate reductase [Penicillium malachiteum]|uniref:Dihydrofolate reductase n=1 Tax=Penicillium malachiteum TaxID=1324776 RepID=UPI0025483A17|nr:Dihydrofolate reductase [Penicillium malachiteum]KAJ5737146.1 Dihydrofolate reductase [Penicillium malachiteum]
MQSPSSSLTLIVATTPIRVASQDPGNPEPRTRLGIGLNGTLPWPRIKADMSFFARVTSRAPEPGTTNAIIMGRKTYDSVPKHLRPLGKRISAIITRDTTGSVRKGVEEDLKKRKEKMAAIAAAKAVENDKEQKDEPITDAIVVPSLDSALEELQEIYGAGQALGKMFVIGGAEIYGAALRREFGDVDGLKRPLRIVMTNVVRKPEGGEEVPFECDTFWPLDCMDERNGWRSASPQELSEWVGEEVTGEWIREGDFEVQMVGYEKLI